VADREEVWVFDSSSIIEVRAAVSRADEKSVFNALRGLTVASHLCWPPEVTQEVEYAVNPDSAVRWIKANRGSGERTAKLDTVKSVLRTAPALVDPDAPREQADPYVVALALDLGEGELFGTAVSIVTEDRKDKPTKLSLATAAGLLRIPTIPLRAFLRSQGILP